MAGDWIKMRANLDTNPKVVSLAASLNTSELHVVGMLWKVWSWADQHSLDGNAISVTESFLDRVTSVTGFAHALRGVGWLDGKDGQLSFPKFSDHNGATAKRREETAERVAKHRQKVKQKCNAETVTDVTPVTGREEKRREEKVKQDCGEPLRDSPPEDSVLTFPTTKGRSGKREWHLTETKIAEYVDAFPGVDVMAESRKALQWCRDNPTKRKTFDGMPKFLGAWMTRVQNAPQRNGNPPPPPQVRDVAHSVEEVLAFRREMGE